jgi:hypothetical protein
MENKWVVIRYPKNETEAQIIKGLLESEGIPVQIKQEAIGKTYGLTLNGLGQIRILVPASSKTEAERLLPE